MRNSVVFSFVVMTILLITACGSGGGTASTSSSSSSSSTSSGSSSGGTFSVISKSPVNGSTLKSDFPVTAIFSAPVDQTLIDTGSFSVTDGTNAVGGTFSFSADNSVVIFTPSAPLTGGVTYTATLSTSIASATGNNLAANVSWSFNAVDAASYSCTITAPPASLNVDTTFYKKYCSANGMAVLGSDVVPDAALQKAWLQTINMLKMRQDIMEVMISRGTRVAIVAESEGITQIPEYADLDTAFPLPNGQSWNDRARGLGATDARPVSSGAEENLLCYLTDPYIGESIFIHEFAHSIEGMGLIHVESDFITRLRQAYNNALAAGRFANTYADDTEYEYWAEGVQSWFNVNLEAIPSNGIHNEINTRAELETYDPELYNLISRVFPTDYQPACP